MVALLLVASVALADVIDVQAMAECEPCPDGQESRECGVNGGGCEALERDPEWRIRCNLGSRKRYCRAPILPEASGCGCRTSAWSPAAGVALLVLAAIRRRTA